MYLATNLKALQTLRNLEQTLWSEDVFVGNTSANHDPKRVEDFQRAVDAFLSMLPATSNLDSSRILLVLDSIRPQLYDKSKLELVHGSYYAVMRRYFIAEARERGFEVIDMQPIFMDHYEKHGLRFEFPNDGHWNSLGHELFENAIAKSGVFLQFSNMLQKK